MSTLHTIKAAKAPNLDEAAAVLGMPVSALDPDFGVVEIDPDHHLFVVNVLADIKSGAASTGKSAIAGPFANTRIEGFR